MQKALRCFIIVATACIGAAGCTSSSSLTTVPPISNVSGDYSGTMQDTLNGAGTATATLAQHGSAVGGAISDQVTAGTLTADVSLTVTSANAVSGSMVVDYGGGTTCTYSTTGTYSPSTNVLSGSFAAVTNCAGDTGTYSLTQLCHDTVASRIEHPFGTPKC